MDGYEAAIDRQCELAAMRIRIAELEREILREVRAQSKTLGIKPPGGDLESNGSSREEYHRRLSQHLDFATKVLHTSGVVAVVWREWRTFERLVQQKLRALNAAPSA